MQNESSTGSSTSNRIRTTLTIRVENIDFDTQACVLRLKGRNIAENQYVKVNSWMYIMGYCWMSSVICMYLVHKNHTLHRVSDGGIPHLGPGSES